MEERWEMRSLPVRQILNQCWMSKFQDYNNYTTEGEAAPMLPLEFKSIGGLNLPPESVVTVALDVPKHIRELWRQA